MFCAVTIIFVVGAAHQHKRRKLNDGEAASKFRPFQEAVEYVRSLKIPTQKAWWVYSASGKRIARTRRRDATRWLGSAMQSNAGGRKRFVPGARFARTCA